MKKNIIYSALDSIVAVAEEKKTGKFMCRWTDFNYDSVRAEFKGYSEQDNRELLIAVNISTHEGTHNCIITLYKDGLYISKDHTVPTEGEKTFLNAVKSLFTQVIGY
jgi:hypothetical protein